MSPFSNQFSNRFTTAWGLSLATALVTATASAGAQDSSMTARPDSASARSAAPSTTPPAGGPALREPVAEMYTDAKIAAVASVSNQSEIQPSQLALQKTQNAQVRQFAQRMIDEHTRFEQQMQQMLQQKNVTPEHNAFSYQLQQNLQPMMRELQGASGRAFDKLYINHQVASHMATLHALDTSLIPQARDPQMKTMLQQQVRPAVANHYAEAMRIQEAVLGQGAGQTGPSR